jgi:hypothetical protein
VQEFGAAAAGVVSFFPGEIVLVWLEGELSSGCRLRPSAGFKRDALPLQLSTKQ